MALSWDKKDPNEVDSFGVDWSERLSASSDTISSSDWIVPSGITEDSASNTTSTTTIWLSGGTDGNDYEIVNRIVTTGGRTLDQTIKLKVRTK
jgi:hypothetical protein